MIKRSISPQIEDALAAFPVVLLSGARQVGKSTLALSLGYHYITLDDITQLDGALTDPIRFVESLPRPVVIDEIQKAPNLLAAIKEAVDHKRNNGDFLLTGSANLLGFKRVADSLAGRMGIVELWPLSCSELSQQPGRNVVDCLFDGSYPTLMKGGGSAEGGQFNLERVLQGGYPEIQKIPSLRARALWFSSYISTYIERDVRDIGELRNLERFVHLVNILSSRSAATLNKAELSRSAGIDQKTLANYLMLLEMVYQIRPVPAYSSNIGKRYTKSAKLYFTDTGVLSHLLSIGGVDDLKSSAHYGSIVETYVFSELLKAMRQCEQKTQLFHYRTSDQREIDFVLLRGEKKVAVELKAAITVRKADFSHIQHLQQSEQGVTGIILYQGEKMVPFGNNTALPLSILC